MRKEIQLSAILAAAIAMAGCSSDNEQANGLNNADNESNGRIALQVTSGIQTRAVNNEWESGDAIGLFMLNGTAIDTYTNTQYTTADNGTEGTFTPASEVIYLPTDGSTRDFIAYYPYQSAMSGSTYSIDLGTQTDQSAIDFMLATKVTGKSRTDYTANFVFQHMLSKVVIKFEAGDGLTASDLSGMTATLTNQQLTGTFDVLNETAVVINAGTSNLSMLTAADGLSAEAIVFPNNGFDGMTLSLATTSMGNYTWPLSDQKNASKFEAGKKYIYTITVNRTGLVVKATITDWEAGNSDEGEKGDAE